MKILVLSHISELVGGAERSILEVMAYWEENYGIKPQFILREPVGTLGPELERRKWKFHSLPYGFWSEANPPKTAEGQHRAALQNSKAIFGIEEIIKKEKPDVVLTNSVVCPWAAIAAHFQGVPHVWFVREYGDLDHGRTFELGQQETFEDVGNLSHLVITNSQALAIHVKQYIPSHKVTTLYHPFDLDKLIDAAQEPVKSPYMSKTSLKLVLPAGSITKSKGFLEAVTAIGELNKQGYDTELCIIGNTHEKDFLAQLQRVMMKYGINDKVHFVGFQKNPLPLVALADVGIMASRMEAFGRVTFEYMALGMPVVGVGAGGTPEMVEDGYNGYLFNYQDMDSLTKALLHYAKDKELIKQHGENSQTRAKEMMKSEFNIDALFKKFQRAIEEREPMPVLHYSHKWLTYPTTADQFLKDQGVVSVKKLVRQRAKAKAKHQVAKAKALYRRKFR